LNTWHIVTSEYPPQPGGVSDYTQVIAAGLAAAGDKVHVWCPAAEGTTPIAAGVDVHRNSGFFSPSDLRQINKTLDQFTGPRRLLVQWVPHGYGYRSMNLAFCVWLWSRSLKGDRVELMVHEPCLEFRRNSLRQNAVAFVHRLMTIILLRAAHRVWVSIPAWEAYWRPYEFGRRKIFSWLPVVSNIPVVDDPAGSREVRLRHAPTGGSIIGHFGAYDRHNTELLLATAAPLISNGSKDVLLLLGRGGEEVRNILIRKSPELKNRVHATGTLSAADLSLHLKACDVMLQPYIDGISSRRCSALAALAHGIPVLTTRGALTETLWDSSKAVALTPVENVSALADETRRLLSDAEERNKMSCSAKALYEQRFNPEITISSLRQAFSAGESAT